MNPLPPAHVNFPYRGPNVIIVFDLCSDLFRSALQITQINNLINYVQLTELMRYREEVGFQGTLYVFKEVIERV